MTKPIPFTRRSVLLTGAAFALSATPAFALPRTATGRFNNTAIKGYDTTAYFQHGEARRGDRSFQLEYQGSNWYFAGETETALFEADPTAYGPQYGGYCTRALSLKKTVAANPEHWRIHNGKLYLFVRAAGADLFDEDPDAMIALAQAYWDTLDLTD